MTAPIAYDFVCTKAKSPGKKIGIKCAGGNADTGLARIDSGETMKAVRLHEYGGPENLKFDADVPDPELGADSILIEASATSVNPIDWKVRSGARQKDFPLALPAILGKDVRGVVHAVGSNIRTFKPGDRVLAQAESTYA